MTMRQTEIENERRKIRGEGKQKEREIRNSQNKWSVINAIGSMAV